MPLKENTLFGEKDKVQIAIKRIQEFEPEEGYYLAFSGGKDSQVIYELAKISGVKFDTHFNLTTVDPPEIVYFIKNNYPDVQIHRPELSMWDIIIKEKVPPTRRARYCCRFLKEKGGIGRVVLTGIRWQESIRRKKRKLVENCLKHRIKTYLHPIIDWTNDEVWEFIKLKELKYCSLYDEGYKRIGCIMCPCANRKEVLLDINRYPKYYKNYLKTFRKMLIARKEKNMKTYWKTPEDVMHWWIYGKEHKGNPDQTVIFE